MQAKWTAGERKKTDLKMSEKTMIKSHRIMTSRRWTNRSNRKETWRTTRRAREVVAEGAAEVEERVLEREGNQQEQADTRSQSQNEQGKKKQVRVRRRVEQRKEQTRQRRAKSQRTKAKAQVEVEEDRKET